MLPQAELLALLRPAGGGVFLVSTGRAEQIALQQRIYGASSEAEVDAKWRAGVASLASAKLAILAVPSDVGAGFLRGANMGPAGVRTTLLASQPDFPAWMRANGVVDLGDVFVVPQLLHDEMLSDAQKDRSRKALYPDLASAERDVLPVSPLSIAERALDLVFAIAPHIKVFVIGGDHSCAWPVSAALARHKADDLGIVQFDAHTDLLEERLGVRYCFATWSRHASRLLSSPRRMIQLGVRASRHDRAHWEKDAGITQLWADECNARPDEAVARVVRELEAAGVKRVYLSNDIDGTDASVADATGTPEDAGLHADFVEKVIRTLGERFDMCAGDIMEVAPPLARTPGGTERTLATSVRYVMATLESMLR